MASCTASLSSWMPLQVHTLEHFIRHQVPDGPIYTLFPLYVLEGGLTIYPLMDTGPFVWRAAGLIPLGSASKTGFWPPRICRPCLPPSHRQLSWSAKRVIWKYLWSTMPGKTGIL